jgi:hypothetical protein
MNDGTAGVWPLPQAQVIPLKPPRPERVQPNDNAANELAPLPNWVAWRYLWRPDADHGNGKWDKPPYLPITYAREPVPPKFADATDPATWRTRAEAMAAYNASLGWKDPFDGIGFVLDGKEDADGLCLACLDLDAWGEEEQQLFKLLGPTYAEVSPSGRGVHALVRCRPFDVAATCKTPTLKAELYCQKRYVTFTGQRIEGTPETIEALPDSVELVRAEIWRAKGLAPRKAKSGRKFEPLRNPDGSPITQNKVFDNWLASMPDSGDSEWDWLDNLPQPPPDPLDFNKLWSAVWALPDVIIADENDWMNLVCRALANEAMRVDDDPATTERLYNLLDARSKINAQGVQPKEYNEAKNRDRFERCMDEYDPSKRPILSGSIYAAAEAKGWSWNVAPTATQFTVGSGAAAASAAIARVRTLTAEQLGLVAIGSRPTLPPPRPWAQGAWMLYGEVMLLGGPTAFGKTAVGVTMGLAYGSGRALLGQKIFSGPQKVLHISSEEPTDELERRYLAAEMHHKITHEHTLNVTVRGNDANNGKPIELMRATAKGGAEVNPEGMAMVERLIEVSEARVALLDPLYSFLAMGLNDNEPMGQLLLQLKALAQRKNIVIVVMHHPAKGRDPESNEAFMGASSIVFAVRSALVIIRATEPEAKAVGALPSMGLFRLFNSKSSYAKPAHEEQWFLQHSVNLGNGAGDWPNGDNVGVVDLYNPRASVVKPPGTISNVEERIALSVINNPPGDIPLTLSAKSPDRYYLDPILKALKAAGVTMLKVDEKAMVAGIVYKLEVGKLITEVHDVLIDKKKGRRRKELRLTEKGHKRLDNDDD